MTKAELIRKIAKRAGVPDSEAKVFFEIFLKKSSELLAPGQAVLLKGFGHFQFKKGKIRPESSEKGRAGRESVFVDLMAYYPARQFEEEVTENLIFNIPSIQFENFNSIDSYFSLSFGKPVIPLKGVKVNEIFIPLTGLELRKLIEAKVDKLVKELEIVKEYTKGSEVLVIDPESAKSHQLEFNWGEVPSGDISGSKKADNKTGDKIEGSEISWDFGADISRQIQEDSILDVDKTEEHLISEDNEEDQVSWDFGASTIDAPVEVSEDENFIFTKPAEEQNKKITERFEKIEPDEDEEQFERVMPVSSGLLNEEENTAEEENLHWDSAKEETAEYDKFEPETKITLDEEEDLPELNESDKTVQFNEDFEKLIPEENIGEDNTESDEETTLLTETEKPVKDAEEAENEEPEKATFSASSVIEKRKEREAYYSRRGTSPIFLIALIVIVGVGIAVYLFLRSTFSPKEISSKELSANISKVEPEIIERDFTIPVTYPYNKVENGTKPTIGSISPEVHKQVTSGGNSKSVNNNSVTPGKTADKNKSNNGRNKVSELIEKTKPKVDPNNLSTFTFENLPPPADEPKVGDNVSSERGSFTVQVSSWKSRTIALEQVTKFKAQGYDAFIEKANIPGKGTWYRVKVRNFKTQKEAEDFLLSNQH